MLAVQTQFRNCKENSSVTSHSRNNEGIVMLENILTSKKQPSKDGTSIFFIESKVKENKSLSLKAREACSVESAGKIQMI